MVTCAMATWPLNNTTVFFSGVHTEGKETLSNVYCKSPIKLRQREVGDFSTGGGGGKILTAALDFVLCLNVPRKLEKYLCMK